MNIQQHLQDHYITNQDLENIKKLWEIIKNDISWLLDEFYKWLPSQENHGEPFRNKEFAKANRKLVEKHWLGFFKGVVDENYIQNRIRIGLVHARIGLPLDTYFNGVAKLYELYESLFDKYNVNQSTAASFGRLFRMEMSIISNTFNEEIKKALNEQNETLKELSAPIARLQKDLLFLSLVGFVDSKRAQDVMHAILDRIATTQSRVFIIDIGGIAVMDTAVANYLIKITKATRLMGCQTILSGLSSSIAQTIIELGIDVTDF